MCGFVRKEEGPRLSYVVLARKWRPQQFQDLLGQTHVTQTLRNALASGRIAQTFLFSGPRGVGKTSAARILAKALCCEASDRPTPEPCGKCQQCIAISNGSSTDVIEIDAASHTGVDNVREVIVEAVRYLPSSARFKVYIIDEVHMLSSSSFNALLKTFEEPPAHVKFVLATTDVHKVPITILSRCQRYDFRLIAGAKIQERLSEILAIESIDHDPGALALVARFADGSMRDAQSLTEQVLAFAGGRRIDGALVREALGSVDEKLVSATFQGIFERRPDQVLRQVAEAHERGLGHVRFAASLVEHARDLVVARVMPNPNDAIDRPSDEVEALITQAKGQRLETLERLFELLCRVQEDVAHTPQARYALEVGLAKLAAEPQSVPVKNLIEQLERLEQRLSGSSTSLSGPGPYPRSAQLRRDNRSVKSVPTTSSRSRSRSSPSRARPALDDSGEPEPERTPPAQSSVPRSETKTVLNEPKPVVEIHSGPSSSKEMSSKPDLSPGEPPIPDAPPPWLVESETRVSGSKRGQGTVSRTPLRKELKRSTETDDPESAYQRFVAQVARKRPALGATLHQVRPLKFEETGISLACETAFDHDKLTEPDTQAALKTAIEHFFQTKVPLEVVRNRRSQSSHGTSRSREIPRTPVEVASDERAARIAEKEARARCRPAIRAVVSELGASITRVRVLGEENAGENQ